MAAEGTYVVIGASLAGAKAAEGMREAGFEGRIVWFHRASPCYVASGVSVTTAALSCVVGAACVCSCCTAWSSAATNTCNS